MRFNILHLSIFPVSSSFSCPIRGESRIWNPNTGSVQLLCQALLSPLPSSPISLLPYPPPPPQSPSLFSLSSPPKNGLILRLKEGMTAVA